MTSRDSWFRRVDSTMLVGPALCLCALVASGCGESGDRVDVSGTAQFAGQPINYGTVEFIPDTAKGHSAPAGTAEIVDGRYNTAETGAGIVPGPHLVRVTAYEERPLTIEDETLPSQAAPPIFFNYPIEADLQGGTYEINVPEEARGRGVGGSRRSAPAGNIP